MRTAAGAPYECLNSRNTKKLRIGSSFSSDRGTVPVGAMLYRPLAAALILLSAFTLFWRLDAVPIWRDEATTANWARLMVETGSLMPYVYHDGQLVVQAPDGHDVNSKMLPAMQSYLQFYVSAISFKLLGVSEWSARVPYALLGALTLFVLWRLGVALFGHGVLALSLPALATTSLYFLNAVRQGRYYALVLLATAWLLLEVTRYLKDQRVARERLFYVKLAAIGFLLYFANYVAFVGTWMSLGLFVLWQGDLRLIRNFIALCSAMAVVVMADFWLLHSEFAGSWPPPDNRSLAETYQRTLISRGKDFWRHIPLVALVPVGFYLGKEALARVSRGGQAIAAVALLTATSGLWLGYRQIREFPELGFWAWAVACLATPAAFYLIWRNLRERRLWVRIAALAGLLLVVSPLLTIAAGKSQTSMRHYYQTMPAAVLLGGLAIAGVQRRSNAMAGALFVGLAIWPNLDSQLGGTEQIVQRQFLADRSYTGPVLDYLREHLEPGDRVAVVRNVKAMTLYFYFPQMRWVGSLNSEAPHNQKFRGLLPDDQFDDAADADWYVLWNQRDETPKGLTDEYEKVFEYEYTQLQSWWDRASSPSTRKYEIYRR